jgi:hypothetical protein
MTDTAVVTGLRNLRLRSDLAEAREAGVKLEARAVQAEASVGGLARDLEDCQASLTMTLERAVLHKVLVATVLSAVPGFLNLVSEAVRAGEGWSKDHRILTLAGSLVVAADWVRELDRFTGQIAAAARERGLERAVDFQKVQAELGGFQPAVLAAVEKAQAQRAAEAAADAAMGGLKTAGGAN